MQTSAAAIPGPAPAPARSQGKPTKVVTYDELVYHAHRGVLSDFFRTQAYKSCLKGIREKGENVSIIPVGMDHEALVKVSATRLLKEHTSSSWSIFFYQWSLFGLTGISSVGAAMGFYITVCHSRMFAPFGPIATVVAWRFWNLLEEAWEQQRYIDYAAQIRDQRQGNPVNSMIKRKKKTMSTDDDSDGEVEDPKVEVT